MLNKSQTFTVFVSSANLQDNKKSLGKLLQNVPNIPVKVAFKVGCLFARKTQKSRWEW